MENKEQEKWSKAVNMINRMDEAEGKHLNFVEHGNNKNPLVPLNESDVRKLLNRHTTDGYVILSACRGEQDFPEIQQMENPMQKSNELNRINNERTKELQKDIKAAGLSYKPVFGAYKEEDADDFTYEQSFFVFPKTINREPVDFQRLVDFANQMIVKYGQDTYLLVTPNGESVAYVNKNGDKTMEFSGDKEYNDYTWNFFTDLHKHSEKYKDNGLKYDKVNGETGEKEGERMSPVRPTRFTLTEVYVNPAPVSYQEGHMRWYEGEYPDWSFKVKK